MSRSTWIVGSSTADVSPANWENPVAYAQCYNPRGGVAGGSYRVQPRTAAPSDDTMALVSSAWLASSAERRRSTCQDPARMQS